MPGPGGRRERARACPRRPDHHADRGDLVLGLENRKPVPTGLGLAAILLAEPFEGFHQRRRRRNRIPRADRRPGVEAAERRRGVAVDQNRIAGEIQCRQVNRERTIEVRLRVVVADVDRLPVGVHQRRLAPVPFLEQRADHVGIHVQQRRQRAGVRDVLHQDPLAHAGEPCVAHLGERDAQIGDIGPEQPLIERPGRVVQQPAPGTDFGDVPAVGGGIERHHQVEMRRPRGIAALADPDLIPGRQPLNVGRKHVLAGDRNAHPEDRLHDEPVGGGRSGPVGGGDLEREVVGLVHKVETASSSQLPASSGSGVTSPGR